MEGVTEQGFRDLSSHANCDTELAGRASPSSCACREEPLPRPSCAKHLGLELDSRRRTVPATFENAPTQRSEPMRHPAHGSKRGGSGRDGGPARLSKSAHLVDRELRHARRRAPLRGARGEHSCATPAQSSVALRCFCRPSRRRRAPNGKIARATTTTRLLERLSLAYVAAGGPSMLTVPLPHARRRRTEPSRWERTSAVASVGSPSPLRQRGCRTPTASERMRARTGCARHGRPRGARRPWLFIRQQAAPFPSLPSSSSTPTVGASGDAGVKGAAGARQAAVEPRTAGRSRDRHHKVAAMPGPEQPLPSANTRTRIAAEQGRKHGKESRPAALPAAGPASSLGTGPWEWPKLS